MNFQCQKWAKSLKNWVSDIKKNKDKGLDKDLTTYLITEPETQIKVFCTEQNKYTPKCFKVISICKLNFA